MPSASSVPKVLFTTTQPGGIKRSAVLAESGVTTLQKPGAGWLRVSCAMDNKHLRVNTRKHVFGYDISTTGHFDSTLQR